MSAPGRIDVDASGAIYVTDASKAVVVKYDKYGKFIRHYKGVPVSGGGVAVTPDGGRIYVSGVDRVSVLDGNTGALVAQLDGFTSAGEIDLDSAGFVFAADAGAMAIRVYNPQGEFQYQFGSRGINPGQFWSIWAMSVDETANEVYVADIATYSTSQPKVQVFDLAGNLKRSLPATTGFGTPAITFFGGITFDRSGRAYFPDTFRNQIRILGLPTAFLQNFGVSGFAQGQLSSPVDSIFDPLTGRLFVTNDGARIEIFGVDGAQNPVNANVKPGLPVPLSPVGGSEVASATPELRFQNAVDPDGNTLSYQVRLFSAGEVAADYSSIPETTAESAVTVTTDLAENGRYEWAVQAFDGKDVSGWSDLNAFYVNAVQEAPAAPVPTLPESGSTVDGASVLAWQGSTDPDPFDAVTGYVLEIAEEPTFVSPVLKQPLEATSVELATLTGYAKLVDGSTYFWRVASVDNHEQVSEPSAVSDFVYDTTLLKVSANVPGASVYLSGNHGYAGQYLGEAPLVIPDFAVGAASILVQRAGFEPFIAQINPALHDNVSVYAPLAPAVMPADLKARSLAAGGVTIQLNGDAAPFAVDFDNDGDIDLLAGDASGVVTLYRGEVALDGTLSYAAGVSLGLPPMAGAVPFAADWNNDGRKDLIVGQADGTVKLYLNAGTEDAPAFGEGSYLAADGVPINVVAAAAPAVVDLDGDGDKDLVVGSASGALAVFRNVGTDEEPQLTAGGNLVRLASPVAPFFTDWDGDGVLELLLSASEHLYLYEPQADGTYAAAGVLTVGAELTGGNGKTKSGTYSLGDNLRVFAFEADGKRGKDLYIGNAAGEIRFARSYGKSFVPAYSAALLEKVSQIEEAVRVEVPALIDNVTAISAAIQSGDFAAALLASEALEALLTPGTELAKSLGELSALLRYTPTI